MPTLYHICLKNPPAHHLRGSSTNRNDFTGRALISSVGVVYRCECPIIPKELTIDPFDGVKSGHSGRRGAQRDAVHRASAATHQMDGFGPPKAGFSRPPDVVMLHLWSARPWREACLAGKREKPVKMVNS